MTATISRPIYQSDTINDIGSISLPQIGSRTADAPVSGIDAFVRRQKNYSSEVLAQADSYYFGGAKRNRHNKATMITHILRVPKAICDRILSFEMEEGWDLEDAKAVPLVACQSALQFLETVLEKDAKVSIPQVSASVFGAVTLAWSRNGSHVAIRVFDEGATFYISEEPGGVRSRGYEERQKSITRVLDFFG